MKGLIHYSNLMFCVFLCCVAHVNTVSATNVSGTISGNVTWTLALSPYDLTGDVTVAASGSLTIEPGVIVRFPEVYFELFIYGDLIAVGNPANAINLEGALGTIGSSIVAFNGSNVNLQYANVKHMGPDYTYDAALRVYGGGVVNLNHVDFNNSETRALSIDKDGIVTMNNCSFVSNGWQDVYAHPNAVGLFGNSNMLPMIHLHGATVYDTVVLPSAGADVDYRLVGDLTIGAGGKMTIEPGLEIQFAEYFHEIFIQGELLAIGTMVNPIRFVGVTTSFGSSIVAQNGGYVDMQYVDIDSMGRDYTYDAALYVYDDADVNLNFVNFSNSETRGLSINKDGIVAMNNCSFMSSGWQDVYAHPNAVDLFGNNNLLPHIHLHAATINDTVVLPPAGNGVDYRLVGDLTIGAAGKMTIEPGLDIQFAEYFHEIFVQGELFAIGTTTNPIRFMSVGTGYGSAIVAQNGGQVDMQYVEFDSMGRDYTYDASLRVYGGAEVNLNFVEFYNSETRGLSIDKDGVVTMNNCSFESSGWQDIYAHPNAVGLFANNNSLPLVHLHSVTINDTVVLPPAGTGVDYRLVGDLAIGVGGKMTIEPGLEIQFADYFHEIFVQGELFAIGTVGNTIRFVNASAGYGSAIVAQNGGYVEMQYVEFDSMGRDYTYDAALRVYGGADVNLNYVHFDNSQTRGLSLDKDGIVTMNNCSFESSGWQDVYAHPNAVGLFANNNSLSDIYFHSGTVYKNCTWPPAGPDARYVLGGDMTIYDTTTLNVMPGVELLFPDSYTEIFMNGTLNAIGSSSSHITFTGPDTLDYGAGIVIGNGGDAMISHADFYRMGADHTYDAALYIQSNNVDVFDCTFVKNEKYGIAILNSATPEMDYLTFQENERGISVASGSSIVSHSNFLNNTFGIYNYGVDTVDARNNYWGHNSGPFHMTLNASASGDEVSDRVLFDPWMNMYQVLAPPCDGIGFVAGVGVIPPGEHRFRDFIDAYGTAVGPNQYKYFAGLEINLLAGFEVELGATFEANIEQCIIE